MLVSSYPDVLAKLPECELVKRLQADVGHDLLIASAKQIDDAFVIQNFNSVPIQAWQDYNLVELAKSVATTMGELEERLSHMSYSYERVETYIQDNTKAVGMLTESMEDISHRLEVLEANQKEGFQRIEALLVGRQAVTSGPGGFVSSSDGTSHLRH